MTGSICGSDRFVGKRFRPGAGILSRHPVTKLTLFGPARAGPARFHSLGSRQARRSPLTHLSAVLVPLLQRVLAVSDSATLLTVRTVLCSVTAFALMLLAGPWGIRQLKRRFRERIASDSARLDQLHAGKRDTPTMGGLLILAALVGSLLAWGDLTSRFVQWGLLLAVGLGLLGGLDDWIKQSTRRKGLSIRQKLLGQIGLSLLVGLGLQQQLGQHPGLLTVHWPWGGGELWLGALFCLWCMLVLTGSSNGVNLTDGLDGLAAGCLIFCGLALAGLTYLAGNRVFAEFLSIPHVPGAGEFSVLLGGMVGAVLGFLWFNTFPAEVFMGDCGALPLGGLIGLGALICRQELLLIVVGGIFVAETLSVVAQVASFRLLGRRVLACAPLHNHFVFRGVHEVKIVIRFWIIAALLAIAGVASLRLG